ncbi:MAG: hypothetical protein WCA21_13765 [Terracidiphilus sp.]
MTKEGSNRFAVGFLVVFFILVMIAIGVSSRRRQHKKEFGKIYRSNDGRYYTRTHDRSGFSDWEYVGGDAGGGDSSFNNGSWSRVPSTPSGLTDTSKVVAEEEGKPTGEVEEESAETNAVEVTESTTESEAEGMDSAADSGSDSGGDGGDGGGDGGGGDGGGGSD